MNCIDIWNCDSGSIISWNSKEDQWLLADPCCYIVLLLQPRYFWLPAELIHSLFSSFRYSRSVQWLAEISKFHFHKCIHSSGNIQNHWNKQVTSHFNIVAEKTDGWRALAFRTPHPPPIFLLAGWALPQPYPTPYFLTVNLYLYIVWRSFSHKQYLT